MKTFLESKSWKNSSLTGSYYKKLREILQTIRKLPPDENADLSKGMISTRHGNYMGKHVRLKKIKSL